MDGPIRQRALWQHNLALVLRQVRAAPATSRADVAAATGLTRATVSSLTDDLLRAGLIAESAVTRRAGAGRPGTALALSPDGPAGLGLEINVDYLAAAVVDLTGTLRHHEVRRVDQRGRPPAAVLADVAAMAAAAVAAAGTPVAAARLAVPGLVGTGGVVRIAPNLGWHDVPVRDPLVADPAWPGGDRSGTPLPVDVDNEANLAALGELARTGDPSFVYVSGEVGIGAGIVVGGALLRGTHGWAGEIGHVTIDPGGPGCGCGARGCLEQYAGQEAILRAAGVPAEPGLAADVAVGRIVDQAGAGDPAMLGALAGAGTALGVAVAGVVNLVDVRTVVLGGAYAPLAGWLAGPVGRELRDRVLTAKWSPVRVRPCALGRDATVLGAAGAVVRDIVAAPAAWISNGIAADGG